MVQRHHLILWARAAKEDFEVSLDKAYRLLLALKEFGPELSPNYLPAYRKKDVKRYDLNLETLRELLKKGVNKEGKTVFLDLGYRVGFFSSMKNADAAGISISVGISNPMFSNTFVVNLPVSFPVYEGPEINSRLVEVFKKCIKIFNPYWGCISNSLNEDRFDGLWNEELPTAIHWVNYFGSDVTKRFGDAKITSSPTHSQERFHDGYLVLLKDGPIDDENEFDIKLQQRAGKHFSL